ncbi:alpha-amylase family glycosyl hydrolase [Streptomyces sp. NPDC091219]|uniref:alpha-amylase family glycosyl hydrolase n=1 Tax=Streptomyces sp. NPDC091219 TaxID=3155193 RepID=UPI00344E378B
MIIHNSRSTFDTRPSGLHTAFNFDYLMTDWNTPDLRAVINSTLTALGAVGAPTTWVMSKHDVMRHASRYGCKPAKKWVANESYVPAGPADLELGTWRARAAALLTLALPGGAYVYQGEELGPPEVEDLPGSVLQDPVWERSGHTD